MTQVSEPIATDTTQIDVQLLDTLRMFMRNYHGMPEYQREIIFDVLREIIKKPSPIEADYLENKKGGK